MFLVFLFGFLKTAGLIEGSVPFQPALFWNSWAAETFGWTQVKWPARLILPAVGWLEEQWRRWSERKDGNNGRGEDDDEEEDDREASEDDNAEEGLKKKTKDEGDDDDWDSYKNMTTTKRV